MQFLLLQSRPIQRAPKNFHMEIGSLPTPPVCPQLHPQYSTPQQSQTPHLCSPALKQAQQFPLLIFSDRFILPACGCPGFFSCQCQETGSLILYSHQGKTNRSLAVPLSPPTTAEAQAATSDVRFISRDESHPGSNTDPTGYVQTLK